jgi:hypothetical protein
MRCLECLASACAEHGIHLDDIAGSTVFLGIRTIQERGRGMVPLYAARVQDLGPDDVAVKVSTAITVCVARPGDCVQ